MIVKLEMLESDAKVLRRAVLFASGDTASENRTLTRLWKMVDEAIKASRTLPPPDAEDCLLKDDEVDLGDDVEAHDFATCRYCIEDATYFLNKQRTTAHLLPPPRPEDCLLRDEDVNIVNIFFHDAATCQECVEDATDVLDERHLMAHLISENLR